MDSSHFEGLNALLASTFPKKCACCGRIYRSVEEFFKQTHDLASGRSCLKSSEDDDGTPIVEVFRNCVCGSTLMDEFGCRRDCTEGGHRRRTLFDELMSVLVRRNIPADQAREMILASMRGEDDGLLALLKASSRVI